MKNLSYSEKLKDPRWQKKRLEIMQRDHFTCQQCDDSESTLNVHHKYYEKGKDPWEYEDSALITLCEYCHEHERELVLLELEILNNFLKHNFLSTQISSISIGIQWLKYKGIDLSSFFWMITDFDETEISEIYNLVYNLKIQRNIEQSK